MDRFAKSVRSWEWLDALKVAGIAIVGTIFGDTVYKVLQLWADDGSIHFEQWAFIRYVLLLIAAYMAMAALVPSIVGLFARRKQSFVEENTSSIEPWAALAVFVSGRRAADGKKPDVTNNVAKKAIDRMMNAPESPLTHVFLMHSSQSRGHADQIAVQLGDGHVMFHLDDLEANFNDLRSTRDVVQRVLDRLESDEIGLQRRDLLIDITGGTGVATAGAVLAAVDESWQDEENRPNLTMIQSDANGDPGDIMTWVDITLVTQR